ncbi:Pentatricopeptide repeat-containing protein [Thalictrum thalictroides]|uniref:Pentatricopeptide repeat-containing protein n=1 Tax=Thalictrum thalictroides TaxID=46969 RepID=A0A7J6XDJ1_THATH|nr:Pentatricopeptide repeat-containing protein [Thalictrum thalictroides]
MLSIKSRKLIIPKPAFLKLRNLSNQVIHSTSSNSYLLYNKLKSTSTLSEVKSVHALLQVHGFLNPSNTHLVLGSQLVNVYVKFDCLREALLVFNRLTQINNFAWNAILRGLINEDQLSETIEFYHFMLKQGAKPDNFTYPLVLKACSGLSALEEGRRVLESIQFNEIHFSVKPNIFVDCAMIDMFAKCGSLDEARKIFDKMPGRDLVSWSAIIGGAVQNGDWYEAMVLFRKMRVEGLRPDSVIVATILPACGRLGAQPHGMALQGCALRSGFDSDLYFSNALMDMYSKCGNTHEARRVFYNIKYKDVVSWSTLIAGHSQNCEYIKSIEVYVEMKHSGIRTNAVTVASILPVLANLKLLKQGKEMHNYVIKNRLDSDVFIGSALIDMYANCGSMREVGHIFEIMSDRDINIWNSMIVGYNLNGDTDSALEIFRRIGESLLRPNSITILSVLPLCTKMGTMRLGKEIHSYATRNGLGSFVSVGNSLMDMYCKCGYLEQGVQVFDQMVEKDIVTYNTIIAAHGVHGHGERSFAFFSQMNNSGIRPDKVTFIALLSACSHAGLVEKGWDLYYSMTAEYGVIPDMEHYSCMVDLLGRSGRLDDAWEFIRKMPMEPEVDVLGSLLGACRVHNRVELAELVGRELFKKNMDDPGYYILLSNIYASKGKWQEASKVRTIIKQKGLTKIPGNSWIQVRHCVHLFRAKERTHKDNKEIEEILECLLLGMQDEGYLPDTSFSLDDLDG